RHRQALKNISTVLEEARSKLRNVLKVSTFLTTMDDFAAMNEACDEFFTWSSKPCRACVAVYQLPRNARVEIECTA
ncbi:Endoribonuclease L-PSP/chorismate mutase-like protein, partial [Lasiosphaeris hirsuta]